MSFNIYGKPKNTQHHLIVVNMYLWDVQTFLLFASETSTFREEKNNRHNKLQRKRCLFVIYIEMMQCASRRGQLWDRNTLVHLNLQVAQDLYRQSSAYCGGFCTCFQDNSSFRFCIQLCQLFHHWTLHLFWFFYWSRECHCFNEYCTLKNFIQGSRCNQYLMKTGLLSSQWN